MIARLAGSLTYPYYWLKWKTEEKCVLKTLNYLDGSARNYEGKIRGLAKTEVIV